MKRKIYILFNLLLLVTTIVGTSFAWTDYKNQDKKQVVIDSGDVKVFYATSSDIVINNLLKASAPNSKSTCDDGRCYRNDFVVSNIGSLNGILNGNMLIKSNNYESGKLMFSVYNGDTKVIEDTPITSSIGDNVKLFTNIPLEENKSVNVFTLFIWLDNSATNQKQSFNGTLTVIGDKDKKGSYVYYDISKSSVSISAGSNANKLLVYGVESSSEIKFQNSNLLDSNNNVKKEIDKTVKIVLTGSTTTNTINIDGVSPTLIFSNIKIDLSSQNDLAAITVINGANVKLNIFGENSIKSGINKESIAVSDDSKVSIDGSGELVSESGEKLTQPTKFSSPNVVDDSQPKTDSNNDNIKEENTNVVEKIIVKENLSPTYKCNTGVLDGTTCVSDASKKYSCSVGTLNDKSCVKNATLKYVCEAGTLNTTDNKCHYKFYSSQCFAFGSCKDITQPASGKTLCDEAGWIKEDFSDEYGSTGVACNKAAESKYVCDDDWTNTGTTCKIDAKVTYVCDTGTLKSDKCITPAIVVVN